MGYVEELRKLVGHRPLIFVGAVVIIENEHGQILLQKRNEPQSRWGLPGGLMELGESTEDTARREVLEETGLTVRDLQLLGVYSGPEHFIVAPNGDQFYVVVTAYFSNHFSGKIDADPAETIECSFHNPNELPQPMVGSHKQMVQDFIRNKTSFRR